MRINEALSVTWEQIGTDSRSLYYQNRPILLKSNIQTLRNELQCREVEVIRLTDIKDLDHVFMINRLN